MPLPRAVLAVTLLLAAACGRPAVAPAPFTDPAAHRASRIAVAPGVRVEVLDWGGTGPALVFLAGGNNTGHSFDTFAPRFTDRFRVLAITRRGLGASDVPNPGPYDGPTLAADVKAVLDSLGIARAVLVGHSFGGVEVSWFAVAYPERVEKLVYLDSGCPGCPPQVRARPFRPRGPPLTGRDTLTPAGMMAYQRRELGFSFPEAELRAINRYAGGTVRAAAPLFVREALAAGAGRPDLAKVTAPALGIFAERATVEQEFRWSARMRRPERTLAQVYVDAVLPTRRAAREQFARALPNLRVEVIPGAEHFIFLSHPDQVERLMRAFLLPRP
ncbi:MAG: alpha/beta fold hydrolase [Longimicrobiaceae bacterium]